MSRARTLAGAIGSDGALNVADVAGLAAVASSGSASDLSTGTLPIARIADGAVTVAKLASGKPVWDSAGKVFINASSSSGSPVGQLQVWENPSSSSYVCIDARSGQAGGLSVGAYTTTLLQGSGANSGGSGNVAIKMHHNDNIDLRGDLSFWTKDNQNTQYERLRIVSTGKIGAGTSDPQSLLHLSAGSSGSVYTALTLQNTDNSSSGQGTQIVFKNSSYSGVEAQKYGYIRYSAVNNYGERGQFLIGTNNGYGVGPVDRFKVDAQGDIYTNLNGGSLYARSGGAYAAITDMGWVAPIQVLETGTGSNSYRYIPMISGTSVSASGYRQHTVFGSYRADVYGYAFIAVGGNDSYPTRAFYFGTNGNFSADGTISGATKSFRIPHPLPALEATHDLVHLSIEAPRADLIYRGKVSLVNGAAQVNIDAASNMTDGTFVALCREVQCFTSNESGWNHVRGSVSGNILSIECQDNTATDTISWMVVGERQDKHMFETAGTDADANLIVEPLRDAKPEIDPNYELTPAPNQSDEASE